MTDNVLYDDDEVEMAESILEVLGEVAFGIMDEEIQKCPEVIQHYVRLMQEQHEDLEAENAELRGVLAWYGDEGNYESSAHAILHLERPNQPIMIDKGQRARDSIGQREVKDAGKV